MRSASGSHTGNRQPAAGDYDGTTNGRGEPHGDGKRVFSSGHIYVGQWKDGRCDGFGKFTYPDGQVFEGEWRDGRRNGPGKLAMPNGECIAGTWVDDTLSGPVRRWLAEDSQPRVNTAPPTMVRKEVPYDPPPTLVVEVRVCREYGCLIVLSSYCLIIVKPYVCRFGAMARALWSSIVVCL